jgi:fructosamine-3-kinase
VNNAAARAAVAAALRHAQLPCDRITLRDLSGGCIHRVLEVALADGSRVVAKLNAATALPMFQEEAASLEALAATATVLTPRVLATLEAGDAAVLLMSRVAPPPTSISCQADAMWRQFGLELASLHLAELPARLARGYGFVGDNHLGATPQPNAWRNDWVAFNAELRLGHQLRLARNRGALSAAESACIEQVIAQLDRLLPRAPRPSLLHGDLWSGNALPTSRGGQLTCAVIDPACSVGDALADLAMMQLFGGFPAACIDAWSERTGIDVRSDDTARQLAVYQLYHVLNHVNLFGGGYMSQAMRLARWLAGEAGAGKPRA